MKIASQTSTALSTPKETEHIICHLHGLNSLNFKHNLSIDCKNPKCKIRDWILIHGKIK